MAVLFACATGGGGFKVLFTMGAIKDIVDLCIKLRDENRDGKVSAAISQIQSFTLALQSEQASQMEQNAKLANENFELKRKILKLDETHAEAIAAIQKKHRAEMAQIKSVNLKSWESLEPITSELLKYMFEKGAEVSNHEIISRFQMKKSVADYHLDVLLGKNHIFKTQYEREENGFDEYQPALYKITSTGREYVVKIIMEG